MVVHVKRRIEDNDRSIGTGFAAIILGSSPFFASSYDIDSRVIQPSFFARFHGELDFLTNSTIFLTWIFICNIHSEELGRVNLKRIHFYFIFHEKILNTLLRMELRTKF